MTELEKKLQASLRRLGIGAQTSVLVAISGGADSTALLDAMCRLRDREGLPGALFAAHLNHLLRGEESEADELFVKHLAASLGVPILVERQAVAEASRAEKGNLEATARRLRYDFLQRAARQCGASVIFTAHTRDDQVETILMRLLRGSGPEGLRGIHSVIELEAGLRLLRPLLDVTRAEVIAHCQHYGITFRVDSSNLSTGFARNRVRHQLLPLLRSFNPRVELALQRLVQQIELDNDCLCEMAAEVVAAASKGDSIALLPLRSLHPALRGRALRLWLRAARGHLRRLNAAHLQAIDRLVTRSQSGRYVELPGGWRLVREFEQLVLAKSSDCAAPAPIHLPAHTSRCFDGFEITLQRLLPRQEAERMVAECSSNQYAAMLRECAELDDLRLRPRAAGDAYVPAGAHHPVKLKRLMIQHKISRHRRASYPVLVTAEDQIVWSPRLPVARQFVPQSEATHCAVVTAREIIPGEFS